MVTARCSRASSSATATAWTRRRAIQDCTSRVCGDATRTRTRAAITACSTARAATPATSSAGRQLRQRRGRWHRSVRCRAMPAANSSTCDSDCTAAFCGDGFVNSLAGGDLRPGRGQRQPMSLCGRGAELHPVQRDLYGDGEPGRPVLRRWADDQRGGLRPQGLANGTPCPYGTSCQRCNATCTTLGGSTAGPSCGDGTPNGPETCDTAGNSDSCDSDCTTATCGDNRVNPQHLVAGVGEQCEPPSTSVCDANCHVAFCGDGTCNNAETNGTCPADCASVCGNGIVENGETCDDTCGGGAAVTGTTATGCSRTCAVESGWSCAGAPSTCTPNCGDGLRVGTEGSCDDGLPAANGDGCSTTCTIESGLSCAGLPSVCAPICGNGVISGTEACDDGLPAANATAAARRARSRAGSAARVSRASAHRPAATAASTPVSSATARISRADCTSVGVDGARGPGRARWAARST